MTDALLRALVDDVPPPGSADLAARVRWLERVIDAIAAERGDGREGHLDAVVTDLKAAIGAVIAWGRGQRTAESLLELEVVMRALITRGVAGLYELLARDLRALAAHGVESEACLIASRALHAAAEATARGEAMPLAHAEALAQVRHRLPLGSP